MRARIVPALLISLFALSACQEPAPTPQATQLPPSQAPPVAASPVPPQATIFAPFPYTADQIRDATPAGRHVTFRVTDQNGVTITNMTFREADEQGTSVHNRVTTAAGALVGETSSTNSWEDLKLHASYPAHFTKISPAQVEVVAGTYQAKLYEIGDGRGGVETRAWFADELPGPPVKMENYVSGQIVFAMELMENRVDAPSETPQTAPSGS